MSKGFKLFVYFLFVVYIVIFAIALFTSIFGDIGENIVIFIIICVLLTETVYNILEDD